MVLRYKHHFFLFLLILSFETRAQTTDFYGRKLNNDICNQLNLTQDERIHKLVSRILDIYSFDNTYAVLPCPNVENCVATIRNGVPYILYNPDFMEEIRTLSFSEKSMPVNQSQWNHLMVLSHEIGHHLNDHLSNPRGLTARDLELKADETAGFILYQLGAPSLEVANNVLRSSSISEDGNSSHPPRLERLKSFKIGWDLAESKYPRSRNIQTESEPAAGYYVDPLIGKMVFVKGGKFAMGCDSNYVNCGSNESPQHNVQIDNFYICETEVTQKQWRDIMGKNPSFFSGCDYCPVESINWNDIQEFITKLNTISEKRNYRLPTEAEWEYAAKGGHKSRSHEYAGGDSLELVGWYFRNSGEKYYEDTWNYSNIRKNMSKPHVVKSKEPNELGLFDMSGNVAEWCWDFYDKDYYQISPAVNPQGPYSGSARVIRGGSIINVSASCLSINRESFIPMGRGFYIGFRLACSP
jgi:formylglycine-generating enzyme required for sulfatase activity